MSCQNNTTRGYLLCGSSSTDYYANGMSVVYHLKDGRFLIFDSGNSSVGEFLYDTLRRLNGEGDINVAAWIITHPHGDHYGALAEICRRPELAARPMIVAGNKVDIAPDRTALEALKAQVEEKGMIFFALVICCATYPNPLPLLIMR